MSDSALTGRCTCGAVAYAMPRPMFTHCCHCTWCQRETGSAFVLNALVETSALRLIRGSVEVAALPTASGQGQNVHRCPACRVALYSTYARAFLSFVRVGTLDDPGAVPPDVHIFTDSKLPWLVIPEGVRTFPAYYDQRSEWPAEASARYLAARAAS